MASAPNQQPQAATVASSNFTKGANVLFSDLERADVRPREPVESHRAPIRDSYQTAIDGDVTNNGFVSGLVDARAGKRVHATRRGFLRGTLTTAAAATAASLGGLFGPARTVQAQTGVIGTYPRRMLTYCPPLNSGDNCQPGCGSSPICTDCCSADGYFRNDPGNGYSLYAGGCGSGDIADGWLWRYADVCGNCSTIEYRCSDGYVQTDTGPAPFICRAVTECIPLGDGQAPGENLPDAASSTNWRPAGSLEVAVDNGGTVALTGWVADGSQQPVDIRVVGDGAILSWGKASLPRADIAGSVRGAGTNVGFSVSFPAEPGVHRYCVDALQGALAVSVGCVSLDVGTGQTVRGSGASGQISSPEPPRDQNPDAAPPTATPVADEAEPEPTAAPAFIIPDPSDTSANPSWGAVQVLRRVDAATGFVSGWAGDIDTTEAPYLSITVDGEPVAVLRPDLSRPDVSAAVPGLGPTTGFAGEFPLPEGQATVCVDVVGAEDGQVVSLGCRALGAAPQADPALQTGVNKPETDGTPLVFDGAIYVGLDQFALVDDRVQISGWAFDPNDRSAVVEIEVSGAGEVVLIDTGSPHRDAANRFGVTDCGFDVLLPLPVGTHPVSVVARSGQVTVAVAEQIFDVS